MLRFDEVGVLPEPEDNAAICSRRLEAGTTIDLDGAVVTLPHTVLEGHRFIVRPVAPGEAITSWNTPFARATRELVPGDYVCTPTSLAAVTARGVEGLPNEPSATNEPLDPYQLDESALNFGAQVTSVEQLSRVLAKLGIACDSMLKKGKLQAKPAAAYFRPLQKCDIVFSSYTLRNQIWRRTGASRYF